MLYYNYNHYFIAKSQRHCVARWKCKAFIKFGKGSTSTFSNSILRLVTGCNFSEKATTGAIHFDIKDKEEKKQDGP